MTTICSDIDTVIKIFHQYDICKNDLISHYKNLNVLISKYSKLDSYDKTVNDLIEETYHLNSVIKDLDYVNSDLSRNNDLLKEQLENIKDDKSDEYIKIFVKKIMLVKDIFNKNCIESSGSSIIATTFYDNFIHGESITFFAFNIIIKTL